MMHHEHSSDNILTRELRDSVADLAMPARPALSAIAARSRAHQQRRRAAFAGVGGAGAAAGAALTLGLTGAFSPAATHQGGTNAANTPVSSTGASTGTIQTDAFTLTSNSNGTSTLRLTLSQLLNPAEFQQALREHGVPAVVKTNSFCVSHPGAPDPAAIGVLTIHLGVKVPAKLSGSLPSGGIPSPGAVPTGTVPTVSPTVSPTRIRGTLPTPGVPAPSQLKKLASRTVTVINPAKIPAGTELFFGYSNNDHALFFDLIDTASYTCSSSM